jgi:hypothetical protein
VPPSRVQTCEVRLEVAARVRLQRVVILHHYEFSRCMSAFSIAETTPGHSGSAVSLGLSKLGVAKQHEDLTCIQQTR